MSFSFPMGRDEISCNKTKHGWGILTSSLCNNWGGGVDYPKVVLCKCGRWCGETGSQARLFVSLG